MIRGCPQPVGTALIELVGIERKINQLNKKIKVFR